MDQLAAMNPQIGALLQNPQMRAMMSDPNFLQQAMNPANIQAMMNMQQSMQQLQGAGLMPRGIPGGMPGGMPGAGGQFGGLDFSSLTGMGGNQGVANPNPSVPAPPADPAVRFASQIVQLHEMGFSDDARNIQALTQAQGNVNAAIERLLGGM